MRTIFGFTSQDAADWREALGGRRFLMTMGAHVVNTLLFSWHYLSEQGYLTTFAATIGMYLLSNNWQRQVEAKAPVVKPPVTPPGQ